METELLDMAHVKGDAMSTNDTISDVTIGYAPVNGLAMYYEIHGSGQPLVLLHGSFMSITTNWGQLLPALAEHRRVVVVELQGHGRTADIDRPFTFEQMADDVAALLQYVDIERADIFGYSMGGSIAIQFAIRHPSMVRKLVIVSASFTHDGSYPEVHKGIEAITPELFTGSPIEADYVRLAPNPNDWPVLIEKIKEMHRAAQDVPAAAIAAIAAPTLTVIGDADGVRPEHAVEMFRLRRGGVFGDLAGLPDSQLAVLPGTTHVAVMMRADLLLAIVPPFLDAPMPDTQ